MNTRPLKVLVACESSGTVRDAFAQRRALAAKQGKTEEQLLARRLPSATC